MAELHETIMGRKLIEHTLPNIGEQLERIADALEKNAASQTITVTVCYYINEEDGKKIYDIEHMYKEFEQKIFDLEQANV